MNRQAFNVTLNMIIGLLFILPILSSSSSVYAQKKTKEKIRHFNAEITVGPYYDSNILKYSDKYITRFLNVEDQGRFHINRYDDLVVQYAAGLSYTNEFIKKLPTTVSFDFSYNKYSYNNIKDWLRFSIGLKQNILPATSIMLSYSYIP